MSEIKVTITPKVKTSTVLRTGATGLPGAAGSAASVTSSNIASALGYTPATAAQGAKADTALQSGAAISTISSLQTALDGKSSTTHTHAYSSLTGLPTIPAAQVNSDWSASSGVAQILNKPTIPSATTDASLLTSGTLADARLSANVVTKAQSIAFAIAL